MTVPTGGEYLDQHEQFENRVTQFINTSDTQPGPLGALFREIGAAWRGYCTSDQDGGVTYAEYDRLSGILAAAIECDDWLRG